MCHHWFILSKHCTGWKKVTEISSTSCHRVKSIISLWLIKCVMPANLLSRPVLLHLKARLWIIFFLLLSEMVENSKCWLVVLSVPLRRRKAWITASHHRYSAGPETPDSPAAGLHPHLLPAPGLHRARHRAHHTQTQEERFVKTFRVTAMMIHGVFFFFKFHPILLVFFRLLSTGVSEVSESTQTRIFHCLPLKHSEVSLNCVNGSFRSRCRSEEFEMDVAEVGACSWEDRNLGELRGKVQSRI